MKIIVEAVTGLLPSTYERREIVLDPDLGNWGEKLTIVTSTGATYTVAENNDGNLTLMERGARTLFSSNEVSNVLEVMAVPLFVPHKIDKPEEQA